MTEQTKSAKTVSVDTRNLDVAKFVISKGYAIADTIGKRQSSISPFDAGVGILKDRQLINSLPWYKKLLRGSPRAKFIATLWFSNESRGASEDNWILEVHGERHIKEMRNEFAAALSSEHDVNITIKVNRSESMEIF